MIKLPVKLVNDDPKQVEKQGYMDIPFLDPHDILHYVHSELQLTVEPESVQSYWRRAAETGVGWATQQHNYDAIPVGIYADETKYGLHESQEKILAVFINLVLFRPQNIRLSRFLVCTIRSKFLLPGTATLNPILQRVVWSMGWASKGIFPTTGFMGGKLSASQENRAGQSLGAVFYVTELRGDLAWHKLALGIGDGWQSTCMCFFCEATATGRRKDLYFEHVGDAAPWRRTIFRDTLEWMTAKLDLNNLCPFVLLPNFSIDAIRTCSMHNVNLGLLFTANGSSLLCGIK
ncbi:unnamed protein product [Symbiodinium sp. CCMP2456]|nr:unnamed protein product [Symbiodinium sp. CCMP2456]